MDQMPDTSQPIRGPTTPDDLRNYNAGAIWGQIVYALKSGWNHNAFFKKSVRVGSGAATLAAADGTDGYIIADGASAALVARDRNDSTKYFTWYENSTIRLNSVQSGDLIIINATTGITTFPSDVLTKGIVQAGSTPTNLTNAAGQIIVGAFANHTITNRLLDYKEGTDTWSGLAIAGATWTPLGANSAFTVADANSVVAISVAGSAIATAAGALTVGSRLNMNSGSTFENLGGAYIQAATYNNVLDGVGTVYLTGLPTGTNHVQVEIYTSAASTGYCRCSTAPATERLRVGVMEFIR